MGDVMGLKKGIKQLVAEAAVRVEMHSVQEAQAFLDDDDRVFVDIRDVRELERDGMIPGAFHAPRGMLEFWVDPDSPYHKDVFSSGKKFVFYCNSDWRSSLATAALSDMGMENISHLQGGFSGWKKAGGPVVEKPKKQAKG